MNLYDYKGSLVQDTSPDPKWKIYWNGKPYRRVDYLATDNRVYHGATYSAVDVRDLKPVSRKELPLYITKLYKTKEFLKLFK